MTCPECSGPIVKVTEPSFLTVTPDWWPEGQPYEPPAQEATRLICLRCEWVKTVIGDA